jgi:3-phenylpropionate/trans-cinnamate dioxygenase ferredoxin component
MAREKLCAVSEFPSDGRKLFKIGGKDIAVFLIDGKYYAINGKCTHMGGPLIKGKLEGKTINCPEHHAVYNLETGELLQQVGKLAGLLKKAKNAEVYPVEVDGDTLFISL